jgi:alkylation response protein AidB-like acyl-CoA dehydrogenase
MDFDLTEHQREIGALTRRILTDHLSAERLRAVEAAPDRFDRELWSALARAGVLAAGLPESAGGGGLGLLEHAAVLIELGRAVAPVPYLWSVAVAAPALARCGRDDLAAAVGRGEVVVTVALAEEPLDLPADPLTRAVPGAGGWIVDGAKATVPHLGVADAVLVAASAPDGPALFLVRPDATGVTVQGQLLVDGDNAPSLELAGVRVAEADRIGGADVLDWLTMRVTVALAAYQLGVLERALELTATHAREREQFGRPIGSFQAVAQRLADAYIDVEALRLTMWEAAWRLDQGLPATAEVATAKFWAADAGHRVAHTAVHVHGGTGLDLDGALHRYFTAAKRTEFAIGGATAQLRRLGAELAAAPA